MYIHLRTCMSTYVIYTLYMYTDNKQEKDLRSDKVILQLWYTRPGLSHHKELVL